MRPLELALLAVELAGLLGLLLGPRLGGRMARIVGYAALLPIPVALAQLWLEGWRWQLAGLTVLALLLPLGWLVRARRRRIPGIVAGVGIAALVLAAVPPVAVPMFALPAPTGPYGIGTATYAWLDESRPEIFTDDPADRRELIGQLWYPTAPGAAGTRVRYLDEAAAVRPLAGLLRLPPFVFDHLAQIGTPAVAGAPVAAAPARWPVLIYLHGRGGYRQANSRQVIQLASQGYVVLTLDQPYAASGVRLPDGRLARLDPRMTDRDFVDAAIPSLAADVSFALDRLAELDRADPSGRFTGRLALDRVGLFGLSLGGAVTAEACRTEPRIKACLPIDNFMPDPVVAEGLRQPTLWLTRDAATMRREGWSEEAIEDTLGSIRATFDDHGPGGWLVQLPGLYHLDFSDAPLITPLARTAGLSGPIDPDRGRLIIDAVTEAFFDHHLRGRSAEPLRTLPDRYPELIMDAT
ncbi:alpha/beta hydrolase family protein [Microlunatus sp. GCM10028923]|uniref:alpha/beta hydrolase family protein n=1 Tax=Microlunatus sp. GCM10028923 TaxID=3273400 RepID=UPI00360F6FDC